MVMQSYTFCKMMTFFRNKKKIRKSKNNGYRSLSDSIRSACLQGPYATVEVSVFRPHCHFCLPIQVALPVILSFRRKTPSLVYSETSSVLTFTSSLFSDISLRVVHSVWLCRTLRILPKGRSQAGLWQRVIVSHEKISTDWSRCGSLSGAPVPPRHLPKQAS